MKVLIINYYYDPVVDAHAYRWGKLAKLWAAQGHEVEVLSGKAKGCPKFACSEGVRVTRVGLFSTTCLYPNKCSGAPSILFEFKISILDILRKLYRFFYWPDGIWHWLPCIILEVIKKRSVKFDLIVSYSPCFSAHLAGLVLKKFGENKSTRWIADYGDPFSVSETMQPNNFVIYRRLNKLFESTVLNSANGVVFTNAKTLQIYSINFGKMLKACIIPHLADILSFYSQRPRLSKNNGSAKINIVYLGGFHKEIREPYQMIDTFAKLSCLREVDFNLNIYGPCNGFDLETLCKGSICYKGSVSRAEALSIMKHSDILVNVENNNCIMTPSKVVECIATGLPIINFSGNGFRSKALDEYKLHGFVHEVNSQGADDSLTLLADFINSVGGKSAPYTVVTEVLRESRIDVVSNQYMFSCGKNDY